MLWGGRFNKEFDKTALKFSSSLASDILLFDEDIDASIAHAEMLMKVNLISNDEMNLIADGLNKIRNDFHNGLWLPDADKFEDIHSAVESKLFELIGETAGKLHTGRSRNDQVATDEKLWIKKNSLLIISLLKNFQKVLIDLAESNINAIIPGYTHLQRAQPISLAFHFLAYVEMAERDKSRFGFVIKESDQCPLGSGALAGSTLPLDRFFVSSKLNFREPTRNALDSVSDRDFILDFLNSCSVGMMHLSKLADELILWNTEEWSFIRLPEEFTTGSSLMPQKKNPDILELIRGKSAKVIGNYVQLINTLKSLPLSYNRDYQEDKQPMFDSYFTYLESLNLLIKILPGIEINKNKFTEEMNKSYLLATDIADWLVLKKVPFREAHKIVGHLVKYCEEKKISFTELTPSDLKNISDYFDENVMNYFDIKTSLQRKKTYGSPNPDFVVEQINFWKNNL